MMNYMNNYMNNRFFKPNYDNDDDDDDKINEINDDNEIIHIGGVFPIKQTRSGLRNYVLGPKKSDS